MATKFGNAWYVRKDRIQTFLPLVDDVHLEIDRTGLGKITIVGNQKYNTFTYGETSSESFEFTGTNYLVFNDAINKLISNAVYGKGGKRTLTFWSYPDKETALLHESGITPSSIYALGVDRNMILAESYPDGFGFGVETHTSTMNEEVLKEIPPGSGKTSYFSHLLTMINTKRKNATGNESEVEQWNSGDSSNLKLDIPDKRWIMTTYVIDHSDSTNYKMEVHLRWVDDEKGTVHFWRKAENMNYDDIEIIQKRATSLNTIWNVGCTSNFASEDSNSMVPSKHFVGGLRNLMLYNCILTDDQQDTIFNNGIDPYVAPMSTNTEADEDQYDQQFWGMYGVIATESNLKFEKTIFDHGTGSGTVIIENEGGATVSDICRQNTSKFGVAARDGSIIAFARDEVAEGDTTNPIPDDRSNSNNSYGNDAVNSSDEIKAITSAAWRGGIISGDKKLSRISSRTLWGGIINGETDMMRIDNNIDPVSLPAGKYITSWEVEFSGSGYNTSYPSFLPKYYYRDRLGRSWRTMGSTNNSGDNTYINEIFWNKQTRYEKIEWVKQIHKLTTDTTVVSGKAYYSFNDGKYMAVTPSQNDNPSQNNWYEKLTDKGINPADQNASDDDVQISNAFNWEPVYWTIAVYEIVREPSLSTSNFANKINLTLIGNDGIKYATYHKYRLPDNNYSGWIFDSFGQSEDAQGSSNFGEEFLNRIYLPHIVIPKLSIPLLRDNVAVEKSPKTDVIDSQNTIETSIQNYGGIVYFYSKSYDNKGSSIQGYKTSLNDDGQVSVIGTSVVANQDSTKLSDKFIAPKTGLYEFTAMANCYFGDNNRTFTFVVTADGKTIKRSTYMGDFVGGGSKGGAPDTSVIKIIMAIKEQKEVTLAVDVENIKINGIFMVAHFMSNWYGTDGSPYVSNVTVNKVEGTDARANYMLEDDKNSDLKHIVLTDIAAKYTKTKAGSSAITQWMSDNGVSIIDPTKSQYME